MPTAQSIYFIPENPPYNGADALSAYCVLSIELIIEYAYKQQNITSDDVCHLIRSEVQAINPQASGIVPTAFVKRRGV